MLCNQRPVRFVLFQKPPFHLPVENFGVDKPSGGKGIFTVLHVGDQVFLQGVSADVRVAVVEVTVPFAAIFPAEFLSR